MFNWPLDRYNKASNIHWASFFLGERLNGLSRFTQSSFEIASGTNRCDMMETCVKPWSDSEEGDRECSLIRDVLLYSWPSVLPFWDPASLHMLNNNSFTLLVKSNPSKLEVNRKVILHLYVSIVWRKWGTKSTICVVSWTVLERDRSYVLYDEIF